MELLYRLPVLLTAGDGIPAPIDLVDRFVVFAGYNGRRRCATLLACAIAREHIAGIRLLRVDSPRKTTLSPPVRMMLRTSLQYSKKALRTAEIVFSSGEYRPTV